MSLILVPANGMPLNQLGTLHSGEALGCHATYYYLYCLSCAEPFASARDNLKILFVKNRKRYIDTRTKHATKIAESDDSGAEDPRVKEIKRFLVLFLHVIEIILGQSAFWSADQHYHHQSVDNLQLQELCQLCLHEFNSCMLNTKSSASTSDNANLTYLPDDLVFKLTLIIIMTIEQLKNKKPIAGVANVPLTNSGSKDSSAKNQLGIYFTSVAFALLFFSHIINHACIRLQAGLAQAANNEQPAVATTVSSEEHDDEDKQDGTDKKRDELEASTKGSVEADEKSRKKKTRNKDKLKKKKMISLLYARRRFVFHYIV
jgi:hypothetical protein